MLTHLAATLPLRTWVLARVDGDEVLVLAAAGDGAAASRGSAFRWSGSLSAGMVEAGVRAAPSLADVPALRDAVPVRDGSVGAYLGVPVCRPDGTMWGVLAGVAPGPVAVDLDEHTPTVELFARLLGGILAAGLRAAAGDREHDRRRIADMHDPITGLGDRDFWDRVLGAEE
ncbi:MAG: hypothetical protein JOZ99_04500, partial [Actinobacteria bacterium]|nr:hypothetical protein [Actinomycetota bacterium]